MGCLGKGPLHLLDDIRGFEDYLIDLMTAPERVEALLEGIFDFLKGIVEQYIKYKADAVYVIDDQAIQTGPLFSMDLWRKYIKPRYKSLFGPAREAGVMVYMHTCGDISQHIPELYECGVNIIDNKQPELWMFSEQALGMKGKISYSSCIDIQTKIYETPLEKIEEETNRLVRALSLPEGGFLGTCYHGTDLNIPVEKKKKMIESFINFKW